LIDKAIHSGGVNTRWMREADPRRLATGAMAAARRCPVFVWSITSRACRWYAAFNGIAPGLN